MIIWVSGAPLTEQRVKPMFPLCTIAIDAARFSMEYLAGMIQDKTNKGRKYIGSELQQLLTRKICCSMMMKGL